MEGARFHRLADLESEPGAGCDRLAGDELEIEPGGAGSCHLLGQRQVRAHGERQARIAPGVLPTPRLDNRPGYGVAGHLHIVEAQMMRYPVGAIDPRTGRAHPLSVQHALAKAAARTEEWRDGEEG